MKIEKVLETVFIEEVNTTALILQARVVAMLWNNQYLDRKECFDYIHEYLPGWVQTSESFKEAEITGVKTAIKADPLKPYKKLFDDLTMYAKENYRGEFNVE